MGANDVVGDVTSMPTGSTWPSYRDGAVGKDPRAKCIEGCGYACGLTKERDDDCRRGVGRSPSSSTRTSTRAGRSGTRNPASGRYNTSCASHSVGSQAFSKVEFLATQPPMLARPFDAAPRHPGRDIAARKTRCVVRRARLGRQVDESARNIRVLIEVVARAHAVVTIGDDQRWIAR